MSHDEAGIDLALLHALQQRPHVPLHVRLTVLIGERLVHHGPERDLVDKPAVDPGNRKTPPLRQAMIASRKAIGRCGFKHHGLLGPVVGVFEADAPWASETDGIDAGVGAARRRSYPSSKS